MRFYQELAGGSVFSRGEIFILLEIFFFIAHFRDINIFYILP